MPPAPIKTLQDLLDAPRGPGHQSPSPRPGIGTDDHLQLVLLQARPACGMTHVVFQGDPQLRTAMLGKQVD